MTDTEKLNLLINKLKEYAEAKHCYDKQGVGYSCRVNGSYVDAFEDGSDYGEITFARTLLESLGETFEYPCLKDNA